MSIMVEVIRYCDDVLEVDEALITRAAEAALSSETRTGNITVLLTTEEEIRSLNAQFRHIDKVTDVLTFPAWEGELLLTPPDGYLGDIAICMSRALEQASTFGHPLSRELAFLTVHGCLHLMGYDHMVEEEEIAMRKKQTAILDSIGLSVNGGEEEKKKMLELAREAMTFAYVPYSHFRVGACLKTADGRYYTGCNIENAAYGPTNCAERTALFKAVSEGMRSFIALAITCSGDRPAFPCGVCRQALSEFCSPEMPVFCADREGNTVDTTLGELLPHSFGPQDLSK